MNSTEIKSTVIEMVDQLKPESEMNLNNLLELPFQKILTEYYSVIPAEYKRLRVTDFHLNEENLPVFNETLNSFGQLEELGLFRTATNMKSDLEPADAHLA